MSSYSQEVTVSKFVVHLLSVISSFFLIHSQNIAPVPSLAKPGCQEKCENLTIPYPFGIEEGCYLDKPFEVVCNNFLNFSPLHFVNGPPIREISLDYVSIYQKATADCYDDPTTLSGDFTVDLNHRQPYFSYSKVKNQFMVLGCNFFGYVVEGETEHCTSWCGSVCEEEDSADTNSDYGIGPPPPFGNCSGIGCCGTSISKDMTKFVVKMGIINPPNSSLHILKRVCGVAFIVDKNFSGYREILNIISSVVDMEPSYAVPVKLNWFVGNVTCGEARETKTYACGNNSFCANFSTVSGHGYRCICSDGYHGNPYLPNGCHDINECELPNVVNTPGSYNCTCPRGYHLDDIERTFRCKRNKHSLAEYCAIGIGTAAAILILFVVAVWMHKKFESRKKEIIRHKHFKRNGGLLMQEQISSAEGSVTKTKLFTIEELEKSTDNFNQSRVLGKGGHGTVYKGMLPDGSIVAVKKSNVVHEDQVNKFINEVLILSQINHRNIVKLLGCCLESQVPLLVYEYISNGTLSNHLHDDVLSTISWENRLQIATEVAGALAYLHSYASIAIFHRDIKSSNILLDKNFRAIVSDFGLSRSLPLHKTHLTTLVAGTFGYFDPEYFRSGQFTAKSDVYAFGVVLTEILTGQKVVSSECSDVGLVFHFRSSMKQGRLFEILDKQVVNEGQEEDILDVAKLAKRCLKWKPKKRPGMREVAANLERLVQAQPFSI